MAEAWFQDSGYVLVDPDTLRDFHPHQAYLIKADDKTAASFTHEDCRLWARRLLRDAAAMRSNIIIDQTSRSFTSTLDTIRELRKTGHQTELHIMATPVQVSRQRIIYRYEKDRAVFGHGRRTPTDVHDGEHSEVSPLAGRTPIGRAISQDRQ